MTRRAIKVTAIFDADDTLWETQSLYSNSKMQFFREMEDKGFPLEDVKTRFEAIDNANVSVFGFSKDRFPKSMRDTYSALCAAYSKPFCEETANLVQNIAFTVFRGSPRIVDGVTKALSELHEGKVRLILATKGDPDVQERRVESSGLKSYFDGIYILAEKGRAEFQEIVRVERVSLTSAWSVGNSVRSDINPALSAGLNAIWIPRETWVHEEAEVTVSDRLHIAKSITEVPRIVFQRR